jgi:hypothetical protein
MADDDESEVRRLVAQGDRLEDDKRALEERLGFAWRQVEELRSRLLEGKRPLQAAEPVDRAARREQAVLVPVTTVELEAAVARLRDVRPLSAIRQRLDQPP